MCGRKDDLVLLTQRTKHFLTWLNENGLLYKPAQENDTVTPD